MAFFALDIDPSTSLSGIEGFRVDQGYPWPVGRADRKVLSAFDVFTQSTKVAFDTGGIITYRAGYGRGDVDTWHGVFEELEAR